jgi:leader peptidase (prepilin peptidase)/N-methyltransferase
MYDLIAFVFQNSFLLRGIILFAFGLIIGSFINVVIYRLPIILKRKWHNNCVEYLEDCNCELIKDEMNLLFPNSFCVKCKAKIPFWANIPLLGYFILNGKCIECKQKISIRYPLVELITAILFTGAGYLTSDTIALPGYLIFISFLLCLFFIDFDNQILPDELTLPLLWLGLIFNLHGLFATSLFNAVLGAALGYSLFWLIYWIFKLITKKEGMGYGDFKLFAAILAWIGYQGLIPVLLLSSTLAIAYFFVLRIYYMIKGLKSLSITQQQIPYGPFLAIAAILFIVSKSYFIELTW